MERFLILCYCEQTTQQKEYLQLNEKPAVTVILFFYIIDADNANF